MNKAALIMAGGRGERFWPKSRKGFPKQFLSLTDDGKTMIQLTIERILPLINIEDIYISTNKEYRGLVLSQLPGIPEENILCEPIGRNTAPCIGLGAVHISKRYEDAIMMVLPSDHLIKFPNMFINTLKDACQIAEKKENLVTIGINPDYPETGYGYIKFDGKIGKDRGFKVDRFVEKPSIELAKEYLASEEYLWNSGMFVWKTSSILNNMKLFMNATYNGLCKVRESINTVSYETVLEKEFNNFESQSIDYGIMEKANSIFVVPGTFGWDDVGSWIAVERIKKSNEDGNVINGDVVTIKTSNSIIQGNKKLIATVGIEDLIIVDTDDATLICAKGSAGDIKKVLENLKQNKRNDYI